MSFLRINGLEIPAMVDGFEYGVEVINDFTRGAEDFLEGATHAVKRTITFDTPYYDRHEAYAIENWVRGNIYFWDFNQRQWDTSAELAFESDNTNFQADPLFSPYALRPSFASITINRLPESVFLREDGCSIGAWTRISPDPFKFGCTTYGTTGAISYSGDTPTANIYNVAFGSVGLSPAISGTPINKTLNYGILHRSSVDSILVSSIAQHGGLVYAPFQFTPEMVTVLHERTEIPSYGLPRRGFVAVSGDCLLGNGETGDAQFMVAHAVIEGVEYISGARRRLRVKLTEK